MITDAAQAERIFAKFPEKIESFRKKGSVLVGDVHPDVIEVVARSRRFPAASALSPSPCSLSNTVRAARLRRGQNANASAAVVR